MKLPVYKQPARQAQICSGNLGGAIVQGWAWAAFANPSCHFSSSTMLETNERNQTRWAFASPIG